ncbi:MAG: response regulator [Planctomycetota bacterium]|jgi:CheY-like chemotaxis protein
MNSQSEHILILEDNPKYQCVLKHTLSSAGFKVTAAPMVAQALKLAEAKHFDLAIVDYYLPDDTGVHFIKLLREIDEYKHTPMIVISAWSEDLNVKSECERLSVQVVSKMGGMADVLEAVSKCLATTCCAT